MDSIIKLRGKLAEAESLVQYVSDELENYSATDSEVQLNFSELKLRGEQYAFYEHPLKKQIFQDEYFALMIYVISLGDKKEEGLTLLYQIVAGCDYKKNLQNLTTDAMTLSEERLSEIIRMIYSADMARTFAIDSLMICYHMGTNDEQLQFLANLYDLMKLDKDFLTEAIQFVKVFDSTFWNNLAEKSRTWKFLTAKDIATYIGGYPAASLEEAAKLEYKRIIISGITYTCKDVLKLDDWKTHEILFMNCRFENCGGIGANNRIVKFAECVFDGNVARYADSREYSTIRTYCWIDKQYTRLFLHFNNHAEFVHCSFKNLKDAVPIMYLGAGLIHTCIFENCSQGPCDGMLFKIYNAKVTKTKFLSCSSSKEKSITIVQGMRNDSDINCIIYSSNSRFIENEFSNCVANLSTYSSSGYCYLLLLDKDSSCAKCKFENIKLYGYLDRGYKASTTTIGLRESTAEDNEGEISTSRVSEIL